MNPEGILDKRFAKLVNKNTCANVAWSTGIKDYILLGDRKKITIQDEKILSDSCEALLGAIYLDKGFSYVSKIIINLWTEELKKVISNNIRLKNKITGIFFKNLKNYLFIN